MQFKNGENWVRCIGRTENKRNFLEQARDQQGHYGAAESERRPRQFAYWPEINKDMALYVKTCINCQTHARKDSHPRHRNLTWFEFKEGVALDSWDQCRPTESESTFCLIDLCTRFVKLWPCTDANSDNVLAGLSDWTSLFGFPDFIATDNAPALVSRKVRSWLQDREIRRREIPSFSPQCNGACERYNQEVLRRLRRIMNSDGKWAKHLPVVEQQLRTCPNRTTGLSAFEMTMGYTPRLTTLPPIRETEEIPDPNSEPTAQRCNAVIIRRWKAIDESIKRQYLRTVKEHTKYAEDSFSPGDQVWLYEAVLDNNHSGKLDKRWKGPLTILSKLAHNYYSARFLDSNKVIKIHRSLLKKVFLRDP